MPLVQVAVRVASPVEEEAARRLGGRGEHDDLDAVAGGDHHRLLHAVAGAQLGERALQDLARERDLLAHGDGRGVVRQADEEDLAHWKVPPWRVTLGTAPIAIIEVRTSAKPASVRSAYLRPCTPMCRSWTMAP